MSVCLILLDIGLEINIIINITSLILLIYNNIILQTYNCTFTRQHVIHM